MLRLESESGWWLVTHVDHARLAGAFSTQWGNELFRAPEPRPHVLRGITCHDDGWAARDQNPQITRQGKPSAFSAELVGKYSAFEEIDLVDYLAVRDRAVRLVAEADTYAALLVSMHTYNLLAARADRNTIRPDQLPLLDEFLDRQRQFQQDLKARLEPKYSSSKDIEENFRLLQACDNLSLISCVDYGQPADLIHPLSLIDGTVKHIHVTRLRERTFRLEPFPLATDELVFDLPARHIKGKIFARPEDLQENYQAAQPEHLKVTITK